MVYMGGIYIYIDGVYGWYIHARSLNYSIICHGLFVFNCLRCEMLICVAIVEFLFISV